MLNLSQYFPITDPTLIFFCCSADDIAFANHHGTTAYSTYHRYGIGGCPCWKYGLNILGRDASLNFLDV